MNPDTIIYSHLRSKVSTKLLYHYLARLMFMIILLCGIAQDTMGQAALKSQEIWPSLDVYYRFNPRFRLYGTIAGTKLDESSYSDGAIAVFADFFTFPFMKILNPIVKRADSLPGKYLWLRVGYQYSATPQSSEDPFKESMIVTEANARFFLPYTVLMSLKNRFDWRFSNGDFNGRYRPRLTLEKDLRTEFLSFTAYGFAEYYANFGNSPVNRLKAQFGVELRVLKQVNYEIFWNHQFANEPEIEEVDAFGMTLKFYIGKGEKLFNLRKSKPKVN